MADKESLGKLFGKAKMWAKEVQQVTQRGSSPQGFQRDDEDRRAEDQQAEQARNDALVEAMLPQPVRDLRDQMDAQRAASRSDGEIRARARRSERVVESSVTLSGAMTGTVQGLAVETEPVEWTGGVYVIVETVDPVPMPVSVASYGVDLLTFCGFTFEVPNGGADGTYHLGGGPNFEAIQYMLNTEEETEGWYFDPSYGPGTITVANGRAALDLTLGCSINERIRLEASIPIHDLGRARE